MAKGLYKLKINFYLICLKLLIVTLYLVLLLKGVWSCVISTVKFAITSPKSGSSKRDAPLATNVLYLGDKK